MNNQAEKQQTIRDILHQSSETNLADCVEMIAPDHIDAIYEMAHYHRGQNVQRPVIAMQVIADVAALVEGKPDNAQFSKPFLITAI